MKKQETFKGKEYRPEDLIIVQKPYGSFGVFAEYPPELIDKIADQYQVFYEKAGDMVPGYRKKFPLEIILDDGGKSKLYVKSKFQDELGLRAKEQFDFYLEERKEADELEKELLAGAPIRHRGPITPELLRKMSNDSRLTNSVVNEVTVNRIAADLYKQKFGEDLPIEKSVGFFADRQGRKWAIFEYIENQVDINSLPKDLQREFREVATALAESVTDRLHSVGIHPGDLLNKGIDNMVIVGDPSLPASLRLIIIDTEEWRPYKKEKR